MEQDYKQILTGLEDAGCTPKEIRDAEKLCDRKDPDALVRHLRRCRCSRMEELHESQRKVDCLDYLIRQTEKRKKESIG